MSLENREQQLRSYTDDTGCGPDTIYIRGVCCVSGKDSMSAANKMTMTHLPMYNTVIIWDNVFKSTLADAEDSGSNKTKSSRSHSSKRKSGKRKGKKSPKQKFIESGEEHFREDFADGSYGSIGEGSGAGIGEGTEPSSLGSFETGIEEGTTCTGKSSTKLLGSFESMTGSYKSSNGQKSKSIKSFGIGEISCESNTLIVLKAMQELGGFASSKRLIDHICKATQANPNVIFQLVNSTLDWTDNMGYIRCVGKYYSLNYDKMFKVNPDLLNQLNRQENVGMLCRNVFGLNAKDKRKRGKRDGKPRPSWK